MEKQEAASLLWEAYGESEDMRQAYKEWVEDELEQPTENTSDEQLERNAKLQESVVMLQKSKRGVELP